MFVLLSYNDRLFCSVCFIWRVHNIWYAYWEWNKRQTTRIFEQLESVQLFEIKEIFCTGKLSYGCALFTMYSWQRQITLGRQAVPINGMCYLFTKLTSCTIYFACIQLTLSCCIMYMFKLHEHTVYTSAFYLQGLGTNTNLITFDTYSI